MTGNDRPRRRGRSRASVDGFRSSDRGVSTTLGYVLTLAITVVLVSGLLIAVGSFVSGQNERVTRAELDVVGQRLAADVEAADRLVEAGGGGPNTTVVIRSRLPETVAGRTYRVAVNESGRDQLVLSARDPDVSVGVSVVTDVPVANATLGGGPVRIAFEGGELEVSSA